MIIHYQQHEHVAQQRQQKHKNVVSEQSNYRRTGGKEGISLPPTQTHTPTCTRGFKSHLRQLRKSDCLGCAVLCLLLSSYLSLRYLDEEMRTNTSYLTYTHVSLRSS